MHTPPKQRHYKHLEKRWIKGFIDWLIRSSMYHRPYVYSGLVLLLVITGIGISKIYTTGNLSEEFKKSDPVFQDLRFLEERFGGVVPLELVIDTRNPGGAYKNSTLKRMDRLQEAMQEVPGVSKALSIVNGLKFVKQAYYRGEPDFYELPGAQDRSFVLSYIPKDSDNGNSLMQSMVDSTGRYARISMQVEDMGKEESAYLQEALMANIAEIFPADRYDVTVTGAWMVFQKGTTYLIKNLIVSLGLAISVIAN